MPELERPDGPLTTTVKWRFPSVHPEGRKFAVAAAFITLAVYFVISHALGWLLQVRHHAANMAVEALRRLCASHEPPEAPTVREFGSRRSAPAAPQRTAEK